MDEATREITISRIFDAPADLVFKACTEAEHLAKWWGPEGFSAPSVESDPRPGGSLNVVMRGPDGVDQTMKAVYREVVPPSLLVVDSEALDAQGNPILRATSTMTFKDRDGKTEVTVTARATALVPEAAIALSGMSAGWTQSLQCLDDLLTGAIDRQIVLARIFPAAPDVVFDAWTHEEQVEKWWGPRGFTVTIDEMDVRPGGKWRFTAHGPDGVDHPVSITYEEIERPTRLVYSVAANAKEPGFRTTVTFDEFMGQTALTMRGVFETASERDEMYDGIEGGSQTLDRLGDYLNGEDR